MVDAAPSMGLHCDFWNSANSAKKRQKAYSHGRQAPCIGLHWDLFEIRQVAFGRNQNNYFCIGGAAPHGLHCDFSITFAWSVLRLVWDYTVFFKFFSKICYFVYGWKKTDSNNQSQWTYQALW